MPHSCAEVRERIDPNHPVANHILPKNRPTYPKANTADLIPT